MTVVLLALFVILVLAARPAGASVRVLREYERAVVFRLGPAGRPARARG